MAPYFLFNVVVCLSLASSGLSARHHIDPLDHAQIRGRASKNNPCGQIASIAPNWKKPNTAPSVPAKLAYECLTSVPFNQTAAATLVNGVKLFIDFHTNIATRKNPPPDFVAKVRPGYDIYGELEKVRANVASKFYANEHAFGMDLLKIFAFTYDGHFQFVPDSTGTAFSFRRSAPSIVSVSSSKNGPQEIYAWTDILQEQLGNTSFKASPITHINGRDVQSYIDDWSKWTYHTDLDTAYNAQFVTLAGGYTDSRWLLGGAFKACGNTNAIYDGPTTEYRFANGTSRSWENEADAYVDFNGVTDGKIFDQTNNFGGFYLDGDYSDVAVLSLPNFLESASIENGFYHTTEKFITGAKAAGKKKLIIDLSSNPGGDISNVFTLFKVLFPHGSDQASALRLQSNEATKLVIEKMTQLGEKFPPTRDSSPKYNGLQDTNYWTSTPFNARGNKDLQGKNFADSNAFLRPGVTHNGDSFTNYFQYDLTGQRNFDYYNQYSSYAKAQQPFAASDVVIMTNGLCDSACAAFVELMRSIQNIQTVTFGGRPRQGLMQATGGTKGIQTLDWLNVYWNVKHAINILSTPEESARLTKSPLGKYLTDGVVAILRQSQGSSSNVNFVDTVRKGDKSNTSLQFVYQPTDCRILFSKAMLADVTSSWKAVADTAWGGKSHCSAGSLGRHGKLRRDLHKRELTAEEKAHTEKIQAWRRNLKPEHFTAESKLRGLVRSRSSKERKGF
ncbi:hypothetical protein HRS9139_02596 [Pyrenophora teres f. teres]|nr:hypothetical protein HRS9139_02596 [Pyrenophora teres f. teres]